MSKIATKAVGNPFYSARFEAARCNERLCSREGAAEEMGIDRTRLARIELGSINPYPEEVLLMMDAYKAPELQNVYCSSFCPLGRAYIKKVCDGDLDRLMLSALALMQRIDKDRADLMEIAADGVIDDTEIVRFNEILRNLDEVANIAESLKIWVRKNME